MKALLQDFGSTYTKVTLINLDPPGLIGTAQAPTTVDTDLMDGLSRALDQFSASELDQIKIRRACSSAAGGLRIVAIGLVPQLTVKAAREAALGAGSRVVATYAYTLTEQEIGEIKEIRPDLILLAGGTDGGEGQTLLNNASLLAESGMMMPVVVAGNKVVASKAAKLLHNRVGRVVVTGNVMPEINVLNPLPARKAIQELYLAEITRAKGLERIQQVTGLVMPTPLAVMRAGELLAKSCDQSVVLVDIGGATTDVHSFCDGRPSMLGRIYKGLPEPFAKRTVEGDLGMRVSVLSLMEAVGRGRLLPLLPFTPENGEIEEYTASVHNQRDTIPRTTRQEWLDYALAVSCIKEAVRRHAGYLEEAYTPDGLMWIQQGKDLTTVDLVVGTGGVLVHAQDPQKIMENALKMESPLTLAPRQTQIALDQHYLLSAIGLLVDVCPEAAKTMLNEAIAPMGRCNL